MKFYQSWMLNKGQLIKAESKSVAAYILAKQTNNNIRHCKESLGEAGEYDVLKCKEITRLADVYGTVKVITMVIDEAGKISVK